MCDFFCTFARKLINHNPMEHYIVSARKYRPTTFESVVGQLALTQTLRNAIRTNHLAHAYLFCGPRGVGKTTCARIFAKAINCMNPNGAEACNECESCRSFNEGRSLNIHELDAASNNSVDDIRNLIEQVRILPQIGQYSLFIIDEVHMLSQQAFNAFLKTLEEPPKHAVFILATTEKHKIIPTILSRCQVYDFNRIKVADAVGYLKHIAEQEGVKYDEESLNLIAQKADGGMRDALSMFDKAVSFCDADLRYKEVAQTLNVLDYDTFFAMTELLLGGDYTTALIRFDEVLAKGFSEQTFMSGLNQHMRDLLLAKGPAISLIELTGTLLERYRSQAAMCSTEFLFGAISLLTEADGRIKQSSNQRLLVELGLMKIAGLGKKKNDDNPLEEVEYSLPSLPDKITPAGVTQPATPTQPTQVAEPSVSTTKSTEPISTAQSNTPQAVPTAPMPEPALQQREQARPQPNPTHSSRHSSALENLSLASLMQSVNHTAQQPDEEHSQSNEVLYDAHSAEKITTHRDSIIAKIQEERPRFIVAFEAMQVAGHTITVEVPSQTLYEEIMRSKTELLYAIARTADINGALELEVKINEQIKVSRPIKLEDRIKYMTEHHPSLLKLKQVLDMEYE